MCKPEADEVFNQRRGDVVVRPIPLARPDVDLVVVAAPVRPTVVIVEDGAR